MCGPARVPSSSKNPVNTGAVTPFPTSRGANVFRERRWTLSSTRRRQRGRRHDSAPLRFGRRFVHAELGEVLLEQRIDDGRRDHEPRHEALQLRILQVLRFPEPLTEREPLPRAQHDDAHVAVAAFEHRVDRSRTAADFRGRFAREHTSAHVRERPIGAERDGLVRRQFHELPGTGLLPLVRARTASRTRPSPRRGRRRRARAGTTECRWGHRP